VTDEFGAIVRSIIGEDADTSTLVALLEKPGFLISASTGYYDYEVRCEIIRQLGLMGSEAALPILRKHLQAYEGSSSTGAESVFRAAQKAITDIMVRLETKKAEEAREKARLLAEDQKILSRRSPTLTITLGRDQLSAEGCNVPHTILVVDDREDDLRKIVQMITQSLEVQVVTSTNVEDALSTLRTRHISLLVTDIVMPMYRLAEEEYTTWERQPTTSHKYLMHGISEVPVEVTRVREVKKNTDDYTHFAGFRLLDEARKLIPWLPVIVVSRYADLQMARKAIASKVQDILSKSDHLRTPDQLIASIKSCMSSAEAALRLQDPDVVAGFLDGASEEVFTLNLLVPLFRSFGYQGIRYIHGSNECGIDLIFYEIDRLGLQRHIGVQVKTVPLNKRAGERTEKNILTVLDQLEQALNSSFCILPEVHEIRLSQVLVVSSGRITQAAREYIQRSFVGKGNSQLIEFFDRDALIDLIVGSNDSKRPGCSPIRA
jgi:CheY-like chemotaxis protein